MDTADREGGQVERETLLAYEAPAAPAAMADRVLAGLRARATRPRRSRRVRTSIAVAASIGVAAIAVLLWPRGPGLASSGGRVAAVRESIAIGARAVAVAEAGSELAWTVVDGAAIVEQRKGDVFYRVTPGQPFVVAAGGARVRVLGTCFRVEVNDMSATRSTGKLLAAAAAGAALSAVVVTVYEGRVRLENAHGQVELAPGQQGTAADAAQVVAEGAAAAGAGDAHLGGGGLLARVRQLEQDLDQAKRKLAEAESRAGQRPVPANAKFAAEERDPSWAPALEQKIQGRLTRFLGLEPGRAAVECRQTCCEIVLDHEAMLRVQDDLQSDVGLRHLYDQPESTTMSGGEDDRVSTTFCLPADHRELRTGQPDRGVEREALIAAARPAIDACMRGAETPVDFTTNMGLEASGEIDRLESVSVPVDHRAVECVERALVGAAHFAPSDRWSLFRIVLHLEPTR